MTYSDCQTGKEVISRSVGRIVDEKTHVFEMYGPGDYLYRLMVEGKDGTQVYSNLVKVQVMRIP